MFNRDLEAAKATLGKILPKFGLLGIDTIRETAMEYAIQQASGEHRALLAAVNTTFWQDTGEFLNLEECGEIQAYRVDVYKSGNGWPWYKNRGTLPFATQLEGTNLWTEQVPLHSAFRDKDYADGRIWMTLPSGRIFLASYKDLEDRTLSPYTEFIYPVQVGGEQAFIHNCYSHARWPSARSKAAQPHRAEFHVVTASHHNFNWADPKGDVTYGGAWVILRRNGTLHAWITSHSVDKDVAAALEAAMTEATRKRY